ncbi:hypothetical protein QJS04_geneDACA000491 [Acorus gramineus]|uniref:Uncharacterized protein n=1 Tax=Acorus gramineus TaxID=55184 RepID=A0AAV9AQN3_ACOGR|nr:hypothetical protein QJS04_geneDACA000491 [Acorus gramineus]
MYTHKNIKRDSTIYKYTYKEILLIYLKRPLERQLILRTKGSTEQSSRRGIPIRGAAISPASASLDRYRFPPTTDTDSSGGYSN